jgi:hypothetical protein
MIADTPKNFTKQTVDVIGKDATAFKDSSYNGNLTRVASLLTFVSPSCLLRISDSLEKYTDYSLGRILRCFSRSHYWIIQSSSILPYRCCRFMSLCFVAHDVGLIYIQSIFIYLVVHYPSPLRRGQSGTELTIQWSSNLDCCHCQRRFRRIC